LEVPGLKSLKAVGKTCRSLTHGQAKRIQDFATKHNTPVTVVGSRARGTANEFSDFDYLIGGNSRTRNAARRDLPRGQAGGEIGAGGRETGNDIFNANKIPLDPSLPHIIFKP
jgi:hypothetical protein